MTAISVTSFGAQAPASTALPTLIQWTPALTGASAFPILPLGTANQVLTVNAGATGMAWESPVNVSLTPNILTTATGTLAAGQPNIVTFNGLCTATLPATCSVGQVIQITSDNLSTFKVAQLAGQQIIAPGVQITVLGVTGYIESTNSATSVTLMCVVANTIFVVTSNTNVLTVV